MLIAFHKPYGVISQFTRDGSDFRTLAEFGFPPRVYPIGRLDADSEGVLLLSDEPELNERLLHPQHGHRRVYWAQVERIPTAEVLRKLAKGVLVQGRKTLPCRAHLLEPQPDLPPRDPPIRFRKNVPDCWMVLELVEGRNRQVRRMTAAIGYPTLRLVRVKIGDFGLGDLPTGKWKILTPDERKLVIQPDAWARAERVAAKKPDRNFPCALPLPCIPKLLVFVGGAGFSPLRRLDGKNALTSDVGWRD